MIKGQFYIELSTQNGRTQISLVELCLAVMASQVLTN